ncbi:MAG: hypothetical protein A3F75_13580 [Betaproteobacteria bacterium RIFCSPLOWO2_12_FULL_64_23]|nr:MAG: hypothetical protein A3F75_13580 [Betaproteobacteria bacterium RIFCSPLOWO2_12_FULL_64_23]
MGATHFLTKTLPRVSTEMSLHVLAYNLKQMMQIFGAKPLMKAMTAQQAVFFCKNPNPICEIRCQKRSRHHDRGEISRRISVFLHRLDPSESQ